MVTVLAEPGSDPGGAGRKITLAEYYRAIGCIDCRFEPGRFAVGQGFDVHQVAGLECIEPIVEPARPIVVNIEFLQQAAAVSAICCDGCGELCH